MTDSDRYTTPEMTKWVMKYDGYKRLAADPAHLGELVRPLQEEFNRTGEVPEWAGVDLLRGWLFYEMRAARFMSTEPADSYGAIVDAIDNNPAARKAERSPLSAHRRA